MLLASLLVFAICSDRAVGLYDEGLILYGAMRVGAGDLPHRDFYTNYGPAQFYVLALLFKIFSPSVLVERCWDALVKAAIVALVDAIEPAGRFAAFATMAWLIAIDGYGYAIFPALALVLAAVLALKPCLRGATSRRRLLAAGMCVGLAALFRYDVGGAMSLVVCVILGFRLFPFVAGVGIVVLPFAAFLAVAGAGPDWLFDIITYPSHAYARMRSLPFPRPGSAPPLALGVYLPPLVCGAAALAAIHPATSRRRLTILMLLVTLVFFAKGYVRVGAAQMAPAIVSALLLLALLPRGPGTLLRGMWLISVAAAAAGTFVALVQSIQLGEVNVLWAEAGGPCTGTADIPRLACFALDRDHIDAIRFVRQNTDPGEKIFVGLGHHDRITLNDVAFYFLAARDSATKWHHMDPGLQTSEPIQREMIDEFSRNCPAYVVLEQQWDGFREPNGSAVSSGVTLLDDDIRRTTTPVAAFGPISIRRRAVPCGRS